MVRGGVTGLSSTLLESGGPLYFTLGSDMSLPHKRFFRLLLSLLVLHVEWDLVLHLYSVVSSLAWN